MTPTLSQPDLVSHITRWLANRGVTASELHRHHCEDKAMPGLWRYDPRHPRSKYLVQRRDGTIPDWPWFVIGAKDPVAPWALRAYAAVSLVILWDWQYARDVWSLAGEFSRFRRQTGTGDPNASQHRQDDPATINRLDNRS